MRGGFAKMMIEVFSTKRPAAVSGGKRGEPVTYLENIPCTPLSVVDSNTRQRLTLNTPHVIMQLFTQDNIDILEKDIVVIDGREYPVKFIEPWPYFSKIRYRVIVEKLIV